MATMIPQSGGGGDLIYPELDSAFRTHAKKKIAPLEIIDLDNDNTPFRCANWGNPPNYGGTGVTVYDFDSNNNLTTSRTGNNTTTNPFMRGTDPVVYSRYIDKYIKVKSSMPGTPGSAIINIYLYVGNGTLQTMGNTDDNATLQSITYDTGMTAYSGKQNTGVVVNACTKGKYLYIAFVVLCPDSGNTSNYPKMNLYVAVIDLDDYSVYRSRSFTQWRSQYTIGNYSAITTSKSRNIGVYYNFLYQDKIYMNIYPYELGKDVMYSYPSNNDDGFTIRIDYNNISAVNDAVELIISNGTITGGGHFYPDDIGVLGSTTLENASPADAINGGSLFVKDHELYYLVADVIGAINQLKCNFNVYKVGVPTISQDGYLYYTGYTNPVHRMCVPISGRFLIQGGNSFPTYFSVLPVNLIKKYIGFALTTSVFNSSQDVYNLSTHFYDINAILDKTEKIQDIDTVLSAVM